ncbi:MAG: efflux RND transporter periplasmic adaptor subunit [Desulfuromonadaceae bacterium]|nr:efflux RND transporter periplasmic adaptor subunit [Desulfuromonadaceae bacterium]
MRPRLLILSLLLGTALVLGSASLPPAHQHVGTAYAAEQQYTCGMHPMIITDEPGQCPICGMDLTPVKATGAAAAAKPTGERKIKYWAAPMDPTYIRDEPGKSPMGMDLVPVYEDETATGTVISIDPVTSQNMGVRVAPVTRNDLTRTIRTVGTVTYDESRQFSINSKIDGWVERLYVNETGQFVKQGAKLLDIYSPQLVSAQEEFLLALNNKLSLSRSPFPSIAESADRLLDASRRRLALWDISSRQINRLEKSGEVVKNLTLYAPYDGIVTMKMVKEGQFIKSGMELLVLSDISQVWVYADIYEYEMPWVKVGQQGKIILPYVGSEPVESVISYIYPYVEPKTRTVKARFELKNPDFILKPDMYVNVRLESESVAGALTIPVEAVLHSGEKQTVFVALGDGKFEPRQVKTGLQGEAGNIEIVQGLLEGEQVVTSAQFMLDSESKLREAIAKMLKRKDPPPQTGSGQGADATADDLFSDDKPANTSAEKLDDLFK